MAIIEEMRHAGVGEPPLTCEHCKRRPADCLLVFDYNDDGHSRDKYLLCWACASEEWCEPDTSHLVLPLFSIRAVEP